MRNRSPTPQRPLAPTVAAPPASGGRVLRRVAAAARSVIDWLRAGYCDDAPRTGYSPLIALHGPVALTPGQINCVVDQLHDGPAGTTDIEVAITKTTDRLPTEHQTRAVERALHREHHPGDSRSIPPTCNR